MNEIINFINHHLQNCVIIFVYLFFLIYIALHNKSIKSIGKIPLFLLFSLIILHFFVGKAYIGQVIVISLFLLFSNLYIFEEYKLYQINKIDNLIFLSSCFTAPFFLLNNFNSIMYAVLLSGFSYLCIRLYIKKVLSEHQQPHFNLDNFGFLFIGSSFILGFSNFLLNLVLMFCLFLPYVLFFGIFNEQDKLKNLNLIILFFISFNLYLIFLLAGYKFYVPLPTL